LKFKPATALVFLALILGAGNVWADAMKTAQAGWREHQKGNHHEAIDLYTQALSAGLSRQYWPLIYNHRGNLYEATGQLDKALADYHRVARLTPHSVVAFLNRGNLYKMKGMLDHALSDFNRAVELDCRVALAYQFRSELYELKGMIKEAIADAKRYLLLAPKDLEGQKRLERLKAR
jgi:tetratricopeptide (TPR) repeat protein